MGSVEESAKHSKESGSSTNEAIGTKEFKAGLGRKPTFLILGGCGFIGRHMVDYLLEYSEKIYIIDKTPPEIAWLNERHTAVFADPKVCFRSANLITQAGCEKAFDNLDIDIDYVFNLAAEVRKGQSEPVYRDGIHKLSLNVIQYVANKLGHCLKTYVEFSTGVLYPDSKTPHKETEKVNLWNHETKYKHQVEQDLCKYLKNYIIIRPATVYGLGDRSANGITTRLVVGGVYKHTKEMMKLPWNSDIKINTVHVTDLARATYYLCKHGKHGEIYNVVDSGDTTQGHLSSLISEIFNINHDYWGTTFSTLAKVDLNDVIEDINDKHMGPWASLCSEFGAPNTPLTPYIHKDALIKKHVALSGEKLRSIGFTSFINPVVTKELLIEILEDFIELNMFPQSLLT